MQKKQKHFPNHGFTLPKYADKTIIMIYILDLIRHIRTKKSSMKAKETPNLHNFYEIYKSLTAVCVHKGVLLHHDIQCKTKPKECMYIYTFDTCFYLSKLSNLCCIHDIHFTSSCIPWESNS